MKLKSIVAAALLLSSAAGAMAVQVVVVGVRFDIVYDTTETGKYGVPSFGAGNTIVWNAPTVPFVAGPPSTFSATTKFKLVAHTGVTLTGITYAESGTYKKPTSSGLVSASGTVQMAGLLPPAATFTANFNTGALPVTGAATNPWAASTGLVALPTATTGVTLTFTDSLKAIGGSTAITQTGSSLVVTAVPEPETYALMLSGLFVVGFLARRRRQD